MDERRQGACYAENSASSFMCPRLTGGCHLIDASALVQVSIGSRLAVRQRRGPSPYHFVTVPEDRSEELRRASEFVTYGWGMIPVAVRIEVEDTVTVTVTVDV